MARIEHITTKRDWLLSALHGRDFGNPPRISPAPTARLLSVDQIAGQIRAALSGAVEGRATAAVFKVLSERVGTPDMAECLRHLEAIHRSEHDAHFDAANAAAKALWDICGDHDIE